LYFLILFPYSFLTYKISRKLQLPTGDARIAIGSNLQPHKLMWLVNLKRKKSFLLEARLSFNLLSKGYHSAVECKFSYDACKVVHSVAHEDKNAHMHTHTYNTKHKKDSLFTFFFPL
jgi:hypothetical protein